MHKKKLIALVLLTSLASAGLGMAISTFYFNFTKTDFKPDQYSWKEPWTVTQLVDFVQVTLDVVGSGYEGQTHNYEFTLKNVASEPNYILLSCNYTVKFKIGTSEETLIQGFHNNPLLYVNNSKTYSGTFAPTLYGTGNISCSINNILWGVNELITWTTQTINPYTGNLQVSPALAVTGATKTYENGTVTFSLKSTDLSTTIVTFTVKVVELNQIVAKETNYVLTKDVTTPFSYKFQCAKGGSLTMLLNITNAHAP